MEAAGQWCLLWQESCHKGDVKGSQTGDTDLQWTPSQQERRLPLLDFWIWVFCNIIHPNLIDRAVNCLCRLCIYSKRKKNLSFFLCNSHCIYLFSSHAWLKESSVHCCAEVAQALNTHWIMRGKRTPLSYSFT